jgi:hypothetical protein
VASGNGTARQIGAVASGKALYAALHVISSSGDGSQTLDVEIESDSADDFTGSETSRITFSQVATSVQSQWGSVDGAITDDWWRAKWTVGGTGSPEFDFVIALGIL